MHPIFTSQHMFENRITEAINQLTQAREDMHAYLNEKDILGCRLGTEIAATGQAIGLAQQALDHLQRHGLPQE